MKYFSPTPEQLRRLQSWRVSTFWVMLLGYIGYYICRGNLSVALPLLSEEFGYSNSQLGIILTSSEIAYATGKFINGPLADRFGGKKIFLTGMAGAILFNVLFPQVRGIFLFAVIWCCCRYFLSMGWGGIIKTIGEWYEPERSGTIMGLISVNFQFGGVAAALFCGLLLDLGANWQGLFYYPALLVSGVWIWSYFSAKDSPHTIYPGVRFGKYASLRRAIADEGKENEQKESLSEILRTLFKLGIFRQILIFSFLTTFLRTVFFFWTPKFLVDIGMTSANAAFKSAVFPFLGCVGTIFLGWYTDKYAKDGDRARMMWIMLAGLMVTLSVIGILVPYGMKYQYLIVIMLGISGFCLYGPYSMSSGALTLDVAGSKRAGSCTGMIDGIGYLGGALAAWSAGYFSDQLGWSEVFYGLAFMAFLTVVSAWYMSATFQRRAQR